MSNAQIEVVVMAQIIEKDRIRSFLDHANSGDVDQFREEMHRHPLIPLDVNLGEDVYHGRSVYHLAAMNGHVEIVRLIDGSDRLSIDVVNAIDRFGLTPLLLSIRGPAPLASRRKKRWLGFAWLGRLRAVWFGFAWLGRLRAVRFGFVWLGRLRAVAPEQHSFRRSSLLSKVQQQKIDIVEILTRSAWVLPDRFCGASSDQDEAEVNCEGFTPFHFAVLMGNIAVVKFLLYQKNRAVGTGYGPVNVHATQWQGQSPLDIAKEHNHAALVELLECHDVTWLRAELEKTANSQNANLVGAALVVTLSFGCYLQPPLGIPDPSSQALTPETSHLRSTNEAFFFTLVAPSLALSMAALMTGTLAVIPSTGVVLKKELKQLRKSVHITALLLFIAIILLAVAAHVASVLVFKSVVFEHGRTSTVQAIIVQETSFFGLLYIVMLAFMYRRVFGWEVAVAITLTVVSLVGFGTVRTIIKSVTSGCPGGIPPCW